MIFPKSRPILFVTALSFESQAVRSARPFWQAVANHSSRTLFQHAQLPLYLVEVGPGFRLAADSFRELLQQLRPRWLINLGICGSLAPQMSWGQTYQIQRIQATRCLRPLEIPVEPALQPLFPPANLLTSHQPVLTAALREHHLQQTGAELVDMEAYYIVEMAQSLDIPVLVLKTVSDFADESSLRILKERRSALRQSLVQTAKRLIAFLFPEEK
ncbi:MAG: hypothetical protein GXO78_10230 [Calditrichaeota bacterium]|nr:hypothetical protein [Calditrichota bacterium]